MLELKDVKYSTDGKCLFENVTFGIYPGEKIGLVGSNGSGKTTLLKLISGQLHSIFGTLERKREFRCFFRNSEPDCLHGRSILSALYPNWFELRKNLQTAMYSMDDRDGIEHYNQAFEDFERAGGYLLEHKVDRSLHELNLGYLETDTPLSTLSGGEVMMVNMIPIMCGSFDLILLDEPTNNLDLVNRDRLAQFILSRKECFIVTSHDRSFLDEVTDRTLYLDDVEKSVTLYSGNYSWSINERRVEKERRQIHYNIQKRMVKRLEEDIRKTKEQALQTEKSTTHDYIRARAKKVALKAKARENRLNKVIENKAVQRPLSSKKTKFTCRGNAKTSSTIFTATNLSIGWKNKVLVDGIDLEMRPGEKIVLTGGNGSGKSTLIKTLLGFIEPIEGKIVLNKYINRSYLSQSRLSSYLEATVIETFRDLVADKNEFKSRESIQRLMNDIKIRSFSFEKRVRELSLGERTKLELSCELLKDPQLLVLDEPTNHLDIESIEAMESMLQGFEGALIVISHDKKFAESIRPDWLWHIQSQKLYVKVFREEEREI